MKIKSTYMIAIICIVGLLTGIVIASPAVTPIWSNTKSYTSTPQTYPPDGTLVLNFPSQSGPVGQAITLTATLNPLPTQYQAQQVVTFYFSYLSTASTQITGDPTTGLALVGPDLSHSSATSVNGVATITMTPQTTGTFYFIAEIATPT